MMGGKTCKCVYIFQISVIIPQSIGILVSVSKCQIHVCQCCVFCIGHIYMQDLLYAVLQHSTTQITVHCMHACVLRVSGLPSSAALYVFTLYHCIQNVHT